SPPPISQDSDKLRRHKHRRPRRSHRMRQYIERDKITLKSHLLQPEIIIPTCIRHQPVNNLSTSSLDILTIFELVNRAKENAPIFLTHKISYLYLVAWGIINL